MLVYVQGFNWESCKAKHYKVLMEQAPKIAAAGFSCIWLPPPSDAVSPQGYLPRDLYLLDTEYGTESELRECIKELQRWNLKVIADIVINHRCAHKQVRRHLRSLCRVPCKASEHARLPWQLLEADAAGLHHVACALGPRTASLLARIQACQGLRHADSTVMQDATGRWNQFGGRLAWSEKAVCCNNSAFGGKGAHKTGEDYTAAPNIDHTQVRSQRFLHFWTLWARQGPMPAPGVESTNAVMPAASCHRESGALPLSLVPIIGVHSQSVWLQENIQKDITEWLTFLKENVGFDGWRFDFTKGYHGRFSKLYVDATVPQMAFGEFWDTCGYTDSVLNYNQDAHRQRTIDWIDATGGTCAAFDFTTKGILQVRCTHS